MATISRHYPHALVMDSNALAVLEDVSVTRGYDEFDVRPASAPGPCFAGVSASNPSMTMSTSNLKIVLDEMTAENVAADLDAVNVDLIYRSGQPSGIRNATGISSSTHYKARLASAGMLFGILLTCRPDSWRR